MQTNENGIFEREEDQREFDFRCWESDSMESHGRKAAYFAGWSHGVEFSRRKRIQAYEDLDLEAIRARMQERQSWYDQSSGMAYPSDSEKDVEALLGAVDRVLAIPKHEIPVFDPPGAFAIQVAQNATLDAVREALGVKDV